MSNLVNILALKKSNTSQSMCKIMDKRKIFINV